MEENITESNLEKLRKIGVKEIAKETRISTARIESILNKDFENIQRVHFVGFVQILERQYKMDLSGLLNEFDEFHKNNTQASKTEEKVQVNDLNLDTQKQRYDAIDERKKQAGSKQKFYITSVIVVIMIFLYLIYQNIASKHESQTIDKQTEQVAIQESGNEQIETNESIEQEDSNAQEGTSQEPQTQEPESSIADTPISNTPTNSINQQTSPETIQEGKMIITTKIALWFDIIDLDTNKRKYQGVTSDTYSIKTDNHRWLLAFGHSNFNLSINGEEQNFEQTNFPLYFIYEPDNGIKKIDNQTYRRLSEQVR